MNNILTEAETEILQRTAKGEEVKVIAVYMKKSPNTIHTYKSNIIDALGANNFNHAIAIAYDIGLFAKDKEVQETREIALELLKTIKGILTLRKVDEDKHKRWHFKIEYFDRETIEATLEKAKFLELKP